MTTVEFLFDVGSPNAYLVHRAIPGIEARTELRFSYVPVLLGGIFKATNNASPGVMYKDIANKRAYMKIETARFLKRFGVTRHRDNPDFPVNTLRMMRALTFARDKDCFAHLIETLFTHMWAEPKKMDEPEILSEVLRGSDLPADAILAGIEDGATKTALIRETERAVARGVFGVPSFLHNGELYFGKECLLEIIQG